MARFAVGLGAVIRSVSDCDAHHLLSYNRALGAVSHPGTSTARSDIARGGAQW